MSSKLRVILGTGEIGRRALVENAPCFAILDEFLSRGWTEIDTAPLYAGGNCEKILGAYFAEKGNRDKVVLDTKANPFNNLSLRRESVLQQATTSLANLQTPSADVYYIHAPDHSTPIEETLEAVQQLYQEGKFKEFGVSNYAAWEVVEIYHICKSRGWVLPTVYQGMYNPITRMVEPELFPALRRLGMRFYAYNPLACGILSGKYRKADIAKEQEGRFWVAEDKFSSLYRQRYWRETVFDGIELVRKTLDEVYGKDKVSLVSSAFRWMNHHSKMEGDDGIVVGCSRLEHLKANLNASTEGPLDDRVVQAYEEVWQMDRNNCVNYFR